MKYAPIYIPTLCRYEHFVRLVESLKRNTWAKYTDIYIALDYPAKDTQWTGYYKICEYLKGDFKEFLSFNVVKRYKNYGSSKNSEDIRKYVLSKYDRFIRTDDDCEFSPNFIEYIDKGLEYAESHEDILAVVGYSYPLEWSHSKKTNAFLSNFLCPMWGTGFLKDRFEKMDFLIKERIMEKYFKQGNWEKSCFTDARYIDFIDGALSMQDENNLKNVFSDIAVSTILPLAGMYVITPVVSKVRNYGFDGTGIYCKNINELSHKKITAYNYDYAKQIIDMDSEYVLALDKSKNCSINRKIVNQFDRRKLTSMLKSDLKVVLYKYAGDEIFKVFYRIKRRLRKML